MSDRQQSALVRSFEDADTDNLLVPTTVGETFHIPSRNWNTLIDAYNSSSKKRFILTALECKSIIEYVKRGVPSVSIFKSYGYPKVKYAALLQTATDLEERFEILYNKDELTELETEEFHFLMRHPLRILMSDVVRADGIADIMFWDKFNEKAKDNPEVLSTIMRARFKEMFSEKTPESGGLNVQINLGGNWAEKLAQ